MLAIEHSILAILSFYPSTGYDIKSEFEHKAAGLYWGMSYGSIYPKLKSLKKRVLFILSNKMKRDVKRNFMNLLQRGGKNLKIGFGFPELSKY